MQMFIEVTSVILVTLIFANAGWLAYNFYEDARARKRRARRMRK